MLKFLDKLDPQIDYHGQELSKKMFYLLISIGYTISLITGVFFQDLKYTLFLGILTVFILFLVCVPSWGFYRKNPLKFKEKKD